MSRAARSLHANSQAVTILTVSLLISAPAIAKGTPSRQDNTSAAAPDVTKLGPQIGEKVPDFSLPDQNGQTRTLASLMGPRGLVLVFNRSADW